MFRFKRLFGHRCGFCGAKIDRFGYRPEDLQVVPETEGDPRQDPAVKRMMRRVGGRCPRCRTVYCAFCFAHGKRTCPRCHHALPHPRGGGVYIDGINYFYGSVENLIAVLSAEASSLWEFLRAYQVEFPDVDKLSALADLQARLIAMVEAGTLGLSKTEKAKANPGGEPLDKHQAMAVLRDRRNWHARAALEGRDYAVWLRATETPGQHGQPRSP